MKEIFLLARPIIKKIEASGYEAYFVGGSVRDLILNREIHDIDIATSATPEEMKRIFPKTIDVGIEHGTILVLHEGRPYEVTTFRSESDYKDFRRPESVTFIRSLHEDLKRRDFTMNAIAMDGDGQLIDPFNGQEDIRNKVIKTVGNPRERFNEDALRLMRAIRFVSQLGFKLEDETERALSTLVHLLDHIAIERIMAEMIKLLEGRYKEVALNLMLRSNLYRHLPSIFNNKDLLFKILQYEFVSLNESGMWLLALHLQNSQSPTDDLKKWKFPTKKIKFLVVAYSFLLKRLQNDWTDTELYRAGIKIARLVEQVSSVLNGQNANIELIEKQIEQLPIKSRSEITVNGNDLINWTKQKPGPWMRIIFEQLETAIISREIPNERSAIRRWLDDKIHSNTNN